MKDPASRDARLVVHVLYRFECGGLQTVLTECVKHMPADRYRHAVISLTDYTDYADRIRAAGVTVYVLNKLPGQSLGTHVKLWKLLRRLRPAIIHTYNIGTIEYNLTALLAGVPVRIHAEHGRDSVEIDGRHRKYNLLRWMVSPFIAAFVPVSDDLVDWLHRVVRIAPRKIVMIPNGVDTSHYAPAQHVDAAMPHRLCIGTVGRADRIKNHAVLLEAFRVLLGRFPAPACDLRLVIVGDGPLFQAMRDSVAREGWADRVWLPGARADVADILRTLSIFVLPSSSEAMPVTILEAMATALPVVATRVGGIPRLVLDGQSGLLVEPGDVQQLADALQAYIDDPVLRRTHGAAGRAHVGDRYSVDAMASAYAALYEECCSKKVPRHRRGVRASADQPHAVAPNEPK